MEKQRSKVGVCALRSGRACGCGASPTRTFDLLSSLQRRLLVVDGLAGQREDPDLRHLPQQLLVAAAERQDLAALRWVLHHLSGSEETSQLCSSRLRNSATASRLGWRRCSGSDTWWLQHPSGAHRPWLWTGRH